LPVVVACGVTLVAPARAAQAAPRLAVPRAIAEGVRLPYAVAGAPAGAAVAVQRLERGGWKTVAVRARGRLRTPFSARRWRVRAVVAGVGVSPAVRVVVRPVTLAAVGDVNLGDGPGQVMAARGPRWPWRRVAPLLRAADVAFGNLECAVSRRGAPVPKRFHFRGRARWLTTVHRFAGLDVLNLANNHVGDYGKAALADTVRNVRSHGMLRVGAGYDSADAARARLITRLGLRIAFVGFSDIGPPSFAAGAHTPGTRFASFAHIRHDVRAARRRADLVIATFHWGVERDPHPTSRQAAFARAALAAGAAAVIGGHPHVLQPVRRLRRHRLIAYSMGNFIWAAPSPQTARTGILRLWLSARGVERARLRHATIVSTQPRLQ
jgi:poly-gamma-glutamate synthesis protein (capsule biosynthesis protein)